MIDGVARGELVEGDLDRLIERRAKQNEAENARAELWQASVRKYHARLDRERMHDRLAWHRAQLERHTATFEELLRRHRVGIKLVEQALGVPTKEGDAA